MSNAENSGRRRRVIIMNADEPKAGNTTTVDGPGGTRTVSAEPRRLRDSDLSQSLMRQFRRACGQTAPLLLRISSAKSGTQTRTFLWDRPSLIIGRAQECDIRLPHAEVSRQHAYLQIVGGRIYCTDLNSGTGTHWSQGSNSRQQGLLDLGEPFSIGPYSLTIEAAPGQLPFEVSPPEDESAGEIPDGLFLDFQDRSSKPQRWAATRDVTIIGSGNCAKVTLVHPTVSKCHCAVVRTADALWVVDLLSEEGTLVNGDLATTARLESGDVLTIGRFSIAAHYGSPLDNDSINVSGDDSQMPARTHGSSGTDLAQLQQRALSMAGRNGEGQGGISEQFVLDVIQQMGVMQQQALQHAQQSMAQALDAVTTTYQKRIETLEQEYESLKQQLGTQPRLESNEHSTPALTDQGWYGPVHPLPPGMIEPEYQHLPEPEHGSFECDDPELREEWLRAKIKVVEDELDRTRKGWGRKLIDLMGY